MAELGVTYLPSAFSSDAGYADLPLALLGLVILYRHPTGQHPAWKPPSLPPQEIYKGVDAGVRSFAPHIHEEASVPPRLPTTTTSLGA